MDLILKSLEICSSKIEKFWQIFQDPARRSLYQESSTELMRLTDDISTLIKTIKNAAKNIDSLDELATAS
jgi:hypothetical protein